MISIDPNVIESTDVIFGPGSTIYGSDALGGVMNFNLINPEFSETNGITISGSTFARFSSANQEKTGHLQLKIGSKRFASFTGLTYSDFNDLRTGSNRTDEFPEFGTRPFFVENFNGRDSIVTNENENIQRSSGFQQWNIIQRLRFQASVNTEIKYTLNYNSTSNIPRYDRLIEITDEGLPVNSEWFFGPQTWVFNTLQIHHTKSTAFFRRIQDNSGISVFLGKVVMIEDSVAPV